MFHVTRPRPNRPPLTSVMVNGIVCHVARPVTGTVSVWPDKTTPPSTEHRCWPQDWSCRVRSRTAKYLVTQKRFGKLINGKLELHDVVSKPIRCPSTSADDMVCRLLKAKSLKILSGSQLMVLASGESRENAGTSTRTRFRWPLPSCRIGPWNARCGERAAGGIFKSLGPSVGLFADDAFTARPGVDRWHR